MRKAEDREKLFRELITAGLLFSGFVVLLIVAVFFAAATNKTAFEIFKDYQTLLTGVAAIVAALIAFSGAIYAAQIQFEGSRLQADIQVKLDKQRREDTRQNYASVMKQIASELAAIMEMRHTDSWEEQIDFEYLPSSVTQAQLLDCIRSLTVTLHQAIKLDWLEASLLGPDVGRLIIELYSYSSRYDRLITECLSFVSEGDPIECDTVFPLIADQALACRQAALVLGNAIQKWQNENVPRNMFED